MLQNDINCIHNKLHVLQERYTYFLLGLSVLAIILSVYDTKGLTLSMSLIPLGLAVISWGVSFYAGCKHLQNIHAYLIENHTYLQVRHGDHPDIGNYKGYVHTASEGIKKAMERSADKILKLGKWQFKLIVTGGFFYVLWHITEMASRSL